MGGKERLKTCKSLRCTALHGFDFFYIEFVSDDKKGVVAVTVGTFLAEFNGEIGPFAVLTVGDGSELFDLQLSLLQKL